MNSNSFEKTISYILAPIGLLAIIINLFFIKGFTVSDGLDALKDLAGLTVAFVVVLLAIKTFKPIKRITTFYDKLEKKIDTWVKDNKYLVCEKSESSYQGKVFDMICDLERFGEEDAAKSTRVKGAFLYFPSKSSFKLKKHILIKINKTTFKKRHGDDYSKLKNLLIEKIGDKIKLVFQDIKIETLSPENEKLEICFSDLEETEENAQRIVDIIEFTKTLILALA